MDGKFIEDSTFVNIAADGSVDLILDRYYEEMGHLYKMETERIVNSAKEHNFYSHKQLVFHYFRDREHIVVNSDPPTTQPKAWSVYKLPKRTRHDSSGGEKRWQIIIKGPRPGVFERSNNEWLGIDPPEVYDYYSTLERAKVVFASAVAQGNVIRTQNIVAKEVVWRGDQYLGQTTDLEILTNTKEWHIVTVGREPGIFSSESHFERNSTRSNVRGIDGGTISVYNTARLAARSFSEALDANRVVRVSVLHVREVMRDTDFPGLIETWKF